jgi:mitochondrial import inner membrane translocase subunit TIM50
MLGRAILPRLRPRLYAAPPIRLAISNPQIRYYARDRRPKDDSDYEIPGGARRPSWLKKSQPPKVSRYEPDTQPLEDFHKLSQEGLEEVEPKEQRRKSLEARRTPVKPPPQALNPKNDIQESIPFEAERVQPEVEPAEQSEEELAKLRAALPDITQGIPSTLAAELSQAQANQRGASPASLNITEDPEEPISPAAGGGGGGDGLPKSAYISSSDQKRNRIVKFVYAGMLLGAIGYAAYLGRNWDDEEEEEKHKDAPSGWGFLLFYNRVKARLTNTLDYYNEPMAKKLLPDENKDPNLRFPFTLVLSLEDLLIHNEWTREHGWRVAKRPGLDYFIRYLSQYYELVLFTSQPSSMADPVLRKLDPYTIIQLPLFREATLYKDGGYIKVRTMCICVNHRLP